MAGKNLPYVPMDIAHPKEGTNIWDGDSSRMVTLLGVAIIIGIVLLVIFNCDLFKR